MRGRIADVVERLRREPFNFNGRLAEVEGDDAEGDRFGARAESLQRGGDRIPQDDDDDQRREGLDERCGRS